MQDIVEALIDHLLTVTAVTTLVATRIYGGDLDEDEVVNMPRKNVVIAQAGGIEEFRTATISRPRFDIFSYGEGYYQAGQVDRAVADALKAISRTVANSTLLHTAGYGQPVRLKHPAAGWEYMLRSVTIIAGETAVV